MQLSLPGVEGQPGAAKLLYQPAAGRESQAARRVARGQRRAVVRHVLRRQHQPRPARIVLPLYVHAAAVSRLSAAGRLARRLLCDHQHQRRPDPDGRPTWSIAQKMLKGEAATEQGFIIDDVVFLLNADLDGKQLPPPGAPNIMMTAGGAQLKKIVEDDGIYWWKFHVDWADPAKTKLDGPVKITVAPYRLPGRRPADECVPQPDTTRKLDVQGDKLMARLVYRRIGDRESIVGAQSVKTAAGGGGIRWYEFRLDKDRNVKLYQQGTYAPDGFYRWMPSPAMDAKGNIGIGYSFGGTPHFPGQRFAGRLADDPLGVMTLREAVLVEGEASQTYTNRWQDYTQTAIDPSDDCTIWYVGDYLKKGATNYSTRIGAFRLGEKKIGTN